MLFALQKTLEKYVNQILSASGWMVMLFAAPVWAQGDWRSQAFSLPVSEMVLLGEQHDAPEHQELARLSIEHLAGKQRLSALVLEMADDGLSTEGMSRQSSESEVRERLQWSDAGWPWSRYGPVVMAAVRAGVPVLGANLPRKAMAGVMADAAWDTKVPSAVLSAHREGMIQSHCGLLPASQVPAMARIQIARDERMAKIAERSMHKGKTVLLLAGAEHVKKDRGIPLFLISSSNHQVSVVWMQAAAVVKQDALLADMSWQTPPIPPKDYCADLARSLKQ